MAKGIPMMGRDPDGKAKIINVDENGNVKVQLNGSLVTIGENTFPVSGGDTLRGLAADRPDASAAHAAIPHCFYFNVDTGEVEITTGTEWRSV